VVAGGCNNLKEDCIFAVHAHRPVLIVVEVSGS
jgi:hypothetical protein